MLPTPSTSHVAFERIYEPAEDSFLLLDTLSSDAEKTFLSTRFNDATPDSTPPGPFSSSPAPFVVEIGTGSGVVLAFLNAHASLIFNRADILTLGVDVNRHACGATAETVRVAAADQAREGKCHGRYVGNVLGDLVTSLRPGSVDVLIFNPPYVPTSLRPDLPVVRGPAEQETRSQWDVDSHLLELSYAGGADGMETTDRLLDALPETLSARGVAYVLLCAQNKPGAVKDRIRAWGEGWEVDTVGSSGMKAGWEKLQIVRISRMIPS
jgi:release factor glutamine methyltransferase